jgi:hypothetical protein
MGAGPARNKSRIRAGLTPLDARAVTTLASLNPKGSDPFVPSRDARSSPPSVRVRPRGPPDLGRGDLGLVIAVDEVGLAVAQNHRLIHDDL